MSNYLFVRIFFQNQGWGDLYTYNGLFYNIQILGNALLPFGVFISLVFYTGMRRVIISSTLLLGMLVAGNFAFVLGMVIFLILLFLTAPYFHTRTFVVASILSIAVIALVAGPAIQFVNSTISKKSQDSNPTRIDQSVVLWEDLTHDPFSFVFGRGLGNTLEVKTKWRDYTDNIYFELQSIYFLNQMGLFNFLIFILSNTLCVIIFLKRPIVKVIYCAYIIYAFFNPYFLDTSHVIVIISLISLEFYQENKFKHFTAELSTNEQ
jgi:membrane protein implicated in regulation of membrane protease activity